MKNNQTFVFFEVAGTTYALPSEAIQQVEMIDRITPLPNASPVVDGMVFSRGKVVPALNLRARFGFERIPTNLKTRLIVVHQGGRTVGLVVDSAREFLPIPVDSIRPPQDTISATSGRYLDGIATLGDRIVLILNVEEIIGSPERDLVTS
jgi:purine-binding chemotaxis protein CheW